MAVLGLALGLALWVAPGSRLAAETVTDLYAAEVTAPDRSEQALERAAREALEQVLVKVSGSSAVLGNASVAPALRRARTYVERYAYRPRPADEEGVGVWFQFSGSDVTDLVTAAGAAVWTANRPVVLSWVAVDGAREPDGEDAPRIVGQGAEAEITQALSSAFSRRGVPNRLPGASAALPADRLAQASTGALLRASEPYGLDDVLFGRMNFDADGRASGRWSYFYEGERQDLSVPPGSEQNFMDAGVNLAADAMARRLAVAPTVGEAAGLLVLSLIHISEPTRPTT